MQIFALEKREGSCKQALKDRRESLSSRHFWYNGWLCPSQGLFSKNYFYAKNKYPIFFLNDRNFFNISTFQFEFIQFPDLSLLFVGNYQKETIIARFNEISVRKRHNFLRFPNFRIFTTYYRAFLQLQNHRSEFV